VGITTHWVSSPLGSSLSGKVTLEVQNYGSSGWVAPLVAVRTWEAAEVGFTTLVEWVPTGVSSYDYEFDFGPVPELAGGKGLIIFV
jgi:hypothetical protein